MPTGAELFPDWRDMIEALLEAEVDFLVVGAFAVATHGHGRATKDIDFFLRPSEQNAERAVLALKRFGAPLHGATPSDFAKPGTVLQLGVPPRRIDLITAIEGVSFDEAAAEAITVKVAGLSIPVIGRAALLQNKRAAGRHQDLADVEALEALSQGASAGRKRPRTTKPQGGGARSRKRSR